MLTPPRPLGRQRLVARSAVVVGTLAALLTVWNAAWSAWDLRRAGVFPASSVTRPLAEAESRQVGLAKAMLAVEVTYAVVVGALTLVAALVLSGRAGRQWLVRASLAAALTRAGLGVATYSDVHEVLAQRAEFRRRPEYRELPPELHRIDQDLDEMHRLTLLTTFGWAGVACGYYLLVAVVFRRRPSAAGGGG